MGKKNKLVLSIGIFLLISVVVLAIPLINFESITIADNTITTNNSFEINVSITESNLDEITYNWNGTNYTLYNDSLELLLNFDNLSSFGENNTYVVDMTNEGNNGTTQGLGAIWTPSGRYGGAYSFNTTHSIVVINKAYFQPPIRASFWIKPSSLGSSWSWVLLKYQGPPSWDGAGIYVDEGNNVGIWLNGASADTYQDSTGIAPIGNWTHVYAEIVNGGTNKIYLNGIKVLDQVISVGAYVESSNMTIGNGFNGSIDEMKFWSRPLSAQEVYIDYISNIRKFDSENWTVYINQSKDATTGLESGNYTYQLFAKNVGGEINSTEKRTVTVTLPAPNISNINITPALDISFFDNYNITVNITNSSLLDSVQVNVSGINGEGNICWGYYANGTCADNTPQTFEMTYFDIDKLWKKEYIRPDTIYPQLEFGPDSVFWGNSNLNVSLNKQNYHIFHFTNNFTLTENSSFWIEFSATPESTSKSKDLQVYLVERGHNISFFQSNWLGDNGVDLVGSVKKTDTHDHAHTPNSSHYLIDLVANEDSTIGSKNLNISDDFWLVFYSVGNDGRGWNLQYLNESLCNNTDAWFTGSWGSWSTSYQQGCPNSHIHLARRIDYIDGVNITVIANYTDGSSSTNTSAFFFADLPNLAPNPTSFTYPENYSYSGFINITWAEVIDPNSDYIVYNLSLLNADGTFNMTLNSSTDKNYIYWNSSSVDDAIYDLRIIACDPSDACANFTLGAVYDNFTVDNTIPSITPVSPINSYYNSTSDPFNLMFNCSATDNIALSNISLYITNKNNASFSLNQTTDVSGTSNSSNWTLSLANGNYTWGCLAYDLAGNSNWSTNRTVLINYSVFLDIDGDGIEDTSDPLLYNETNVTTTGVTSLNITVSGNETNRTYLGVEEVTFYDSNVLILNFSHNFSQSDLDLSNITITKTTTSLIINMSGQLQGNKTLYIADSSFATLCVKDAEVNVITNVSSACNGDNETNLNSCLGSSLTSNGITCTDLGSIIKIDNLKYTAIRATQTSSPTPTSSSSSSSGSGSGISSICGNGICTKVYNEDCSTCPEDCGVCKEEIISEKISTTDNLIPIDKTQSILEDGFDEGIVPDEDLGIENINDSLTEEVNKTKSEKETISYIYWLSALLIVLSLFFIIFLPKRNIRQDNSQ